MAYKDPHDPRLLAARRKHYHNNKKRYQERARANERAIREKIIERKSVPCADCGISYPFYVMDFDHREDKKFTMARIHKQGSWTAVELELAKCDVVCSNCHRERTWSRAGKAMVAEEPPKLLSIGFDS